MTTKYTYSFQFPLTSDNPSSEVTAEEFWTAIRLYLHSISEGEIGDATTLLTEQVLPNGVPTPMTFATIDYVDAAVAAQQDAGGPFLPLIGGTVTGAVDATTFTNYASREQTGGVFNTPLGIYGQLSGIKTGGNIGFARIDLLSDTLDAGAGGVTTLAIDQTSGGADATGNRIGLFINFSYSGGPTNKGLGIGGLYGGVWSYAVASGSVGGTAGAGNAWGSLWGGISSASLTSGATYWTSCVGHEVSTGVGAGASAAYVQGLKIVLANHTQAPQAATDFFLGVAKLNSTDVGMANGVTFGSADGYWPVDSTGTLIGTQASVRSAPPPMTAANGVDLSAVTFSAAAFKSTGFQVDGSGNATVARAGFNGTAPIAKPTGVAVTAEAIHAALVSYGLIAGP